jgi:hypothetical protein
MDKTEHFKQYLSGFFDGDGSIGLEKQGTSGYTLRIKFYQSNQDFINTIHRVYPFLNKTLGSLRDDNSRIEFELRAAGIQIEPLIDDLLPYSILKYEQLLEAKKYFKLIKVQNKKDEKEQIYNKLKALKKQSVLKPYERLCVPYIAGLFDAEGCVKLYDDLTINITQKSDIVILQKIADMYNNTNKISNYAINFYGSNCLKVLEDILPFIIYKKTQVTAALEFLKTKNKDNTQKNLKELKEQYRQIVSDEKHVDINKNNILFKNQEAHKNYLIKCFNNFKDLSYEDTILDCKYEQIKNSNINSKFDNKIFNLSNWTKFNIKPVLEFCENTNQQQIYNYYRKIISSLPETGIIGRVIKILVKDEITNKYIGIMCLSSDIYSLGDRDSYLQNTSNIDWNNNKDTYLKNILNLACCVPLSPFGFNTTGGKLLASLAFSKEIFDYYQHKYNEPLLGIMTTSINGKSIQYDRLNCLKMIGYTKGEGSVNIPEILHKNCIEYNNTWKVIPELERKGRLPFMKSIISHLNLPRDILFHNHKRGIYFGYLFTTKFSENFNIDELKSIDQIYNEWKNRWCNRRLENLQKINGFQKEPKIYHIKDNKFCLGDTILTFKPYNLPTIDEKIFTDNLIKDILTYKSDYHTQEEVIVEIYKKYNMYITKKDIIDINKGIIKPIVEDTEYTTLFNKPKRQTSGNRKYSDEEIYFVLDYKKDHPEISQKDIIPIFYNKFNKQISSTLVSNIISQKIKPLTERIEKTNTKKNISISNQEDKLKLLNNEQLFEIIRMKSENKTTQEVSLYIKSNFNGIYIPRNIISKLWNNELNSSLNDEIKNSEIYKNMLNNKKQRTVKAKKFTEIEIEFVKTTNGSLLEISKAFFENFNKTITREYISKIRNK